MVIAAAIAMGRFFCNLKNRPKHIYGMEYSVLHDKHLSIHNFEIQLQNLRNSQLINWDWLNDANHYLMLIFPR